ncbi:MAG: class IV adenylate cyclase [Ignavibacteriaceae bacterium]|nr:class IV adenylate cyclase [Ignavibacteriaceae bacterium]
MPRNLEIKIKLDSLKDVRQKLKQHRIELKEVLIQKDVYYAVDKGLLKLRIENGKSSLIYYLRNEKSQKRWSDFKLVKLAEGNHEKFFIKFLNTENTVSKIRELYLYNDTRIHLDKVKGLGSFIELETIVVNGLKDAEKRFAIMIKVLDLKTDNQIRASYRDLLLKKINDTNKITKR